MLALYQKPIEKYSQNYDEFYQDDEIFPKTLKNFVKEYYRLCDYSELVNKFRETHVLGQDRRHELFITHIKKFLNTIMLYADGYSVLVKKLPLPEILRLVDYLGYEIGLAGHGHGNDSLLSIFKKYCKADWFKC